MENYGFIGKGKELFQSYLKGRYHRVLIDNKTKHNTMVSNWARIKHGVPQDSVLAPTLFLLCIHDLLAVIYKKAVPVLFVDDTSILCTHRNFMESHENIEIVFENVNMWFKKNFISLYIEKTHYIHFKTKKSQPTDINICLDNKRISDNSYTKFLGLIVDNKLSWKPHIDHLINKLSTACYVIRSVKPHVNTNAIIMIYHSLFHAVMTYGKIFWGNSSHSTQVFRMQKKRQLGLLQGMVTENPVGTCSKN